MSDTDVDEPALRAALGAARPDADSVAIETVGFGNRKRTRRVRFASADPVVVQTRERERALRDEAALLRAVRRRTSVPVPPVLAAGSADGTAYLVTGHVSGANLHDRFTGFDRDARATIARAFGRHLASLHRAFRFRRFGDVESVAGTDASDADGDDSESGGPPADLRATGPSDYQEWLADYGLAAVERLPPAFDDLDAALRAVVADPHVEPAPTPRLFPWDLRPGNAVVDGEALAAILDWERPRAADAALAFAKTEYLVADWYVDDPEPLREAFRNGYASVRPLPDVTPAHRVVAVADSAVDSRATVTNPGYPPRERDAAVAFHRASLSAALPD